MTQMSPILRRFRLFRRVAHSSIPASDSRIKDIHIAERLPLCFVSF